MNYFESIGLELKVEEKDRIFPSKTNGGGVLAALKSELRKYRVEVLKDCFVESVSRKNSGFIINVSQDNEFKTLEGKKLIVACGGKAYPRSGSDAGAFDWLQELGHKIIEPKPALCPIVLSKAPSSLQGLSLENAALKLSGTKQISREPIIFTHFGLSGPAALNLSAYVKHGASLSIDFFPDKTKDEVDNEIIAVCKEFPNKFLKTILGKYLQERLIVYIFKTNNISFETKCHSLSKIERTKVVEILKSLSFEINGTLGFDAAMSSTGGIDLKEVDNRTMESKLVPNLYFCGDVLNMKRPTGDIVCKCVGRRDIWREMNEI